jgi:hypothetical protein
MRAIERVVQALEAHGCNPRRNSNGYSFKCPAHDDHRPSGSLTEEQGQVLIRCHAGCHTEDILAALGLFVAVLLLPAAAQAQAAAPATPPEMVATYDALADAILAVKRTEDNLVRSILAAAHAHAQVQFDRAQRAISAGDTKAAQGAIESLAADVGQLATEGDNSVGVVRKRLLEGGHHHNAAGEAQGLYDEGFVVVTRAAKQKLLESSRAIGQMAGAPKTDALDAQWQQVKTVYDGLKKPAK